MRRLGLLLALLPAFVTSAFGAPPSTTTGTMPAFPLKWSADQRHLVDQNGKPFLVVGDTAWSLIAQLDEADIARYLEDRAGRGFNAIIVNLIEHKFATRAPAKRDGVAPFLKPGDFTQPNPAYFDYARRAIEAANQRGITVWLCPAYLGWGGGDEGFSQELKAAGLAALRGYGRYVGERFKDLLNLVWMVGGDYALPPAERWAGAELALGLRDGGAAQLITAHGGQTSAVETFGDQPWLGVDTVYRYQPDLWRPLRANNARRPVRPFVLIESTYEGEHKSTPEQIRRQAWWAVLSGACGQFFGNNAIWHFDGPGLFKTDVTWQQALDSVGSRDIARIGTLFAGRPWSRLQPDLEDKLVTSDRGDGTRFISAARTPDGTMALLYIPADGQSPRPFTLNLSSFPGPVTVHWFNPARDAALGPHEAVLQNREGQILHTPGDNGTGVNDWVLILERAGIRVDAGFPGGNILVQRVEGDTAFVAPDQRDTQTGQWWFYWNFRLRAPAAQPVTVIFTEKNPIGVRGPAVSSDHGATWRWLGAGAVKTYQFNGKPAWSFSTQAPTGAAEVRYAFCPQYLESHLRTWLAQHKDHPALRVEELCRSRKGRPVELVRAGSGSDIVLLSSRHHCCEAMATYAMEGFLDAVLAEDLSRRWQVIAVPFMDKDGVEDGDQGKFRAPHDHNRDYNAQPLYPEVAALMKLGAALTNRVVAMFDLHCPYIRGEWNDRVYFVGASDPDRWEQQKLFAAALERVQQGTIRFRASDCLAFGTAWNTKSNYQQGQSAGEWAQAAFPAARLVASMEIAYADARGDEVNADSARALGRDLARALGEHLSASKASNP